jgi:S1-C subfamily serine protease
MNWNMIYLLTANNMPMDERLGYALRMLIVGLGMVFVVLALLWGVLELSRVIFYDMPRRRREEEIEAAHSKAAPVPATPTPAPAPAPAAKETPAHASPECAVSVYEHNINAVCEIDAFNDQGIGGSGTGFLINDQGILLTNVHVATVNNVAATDITVTVAGEKVPARVLELGDNRGGDGTGIDVAVLKLVRIPRKSTHVTVGSSKDIKHGENIYYIGNSLG